MTNRGTSDTNGKAGVCYDREQNEPTNNEGILKLVKRIMLNRYRGDTMKQCIMT